MRLVNKGTGMGHQLNYFMMPEDTRLLEKTLREKSSVLFLASKSSEAKPVQLPDLEIAEFGKTWLRALLVPPEALASVLMKHVPQQGYWLVDSDRSPVIEMDRCHHDGKALGEGRLYYQRKFLDQGQWVEKPAAFQAWARKIFALTRKTLQWLPEKSYYVGPHALAAQQQGRVKLMMSFDRPLFP